ncbi:hypothetical protein [Ramlibacter albus]|uniref:Uncharacterized protein n=1 Tax=Ramlibacter albus TaxID=2079448 RepID=A0A923S6Z0_9BURK|nr:hypothetical protein [Ramlibacter albus]MBC5766642.1 hypothetical protein [Ramlibacter albus]
MGFATQAATSWVGFEAAQRLVGHTGDDVSGAALDLKLAAATVGVATFGTVVAARAGPLLRAGLEARLERELLRCHAAALYTAVFLVAAVAPVATAFVAGAIGGARRGQAVLDCVAFIYVAGFVRDLANEYIPRPLMLHLHDMEPHADSPFLIGRRLGPQEALRRRSGYAMACSMVPNVVFAAIGRYLQGTAIPGHPAIAFALTRGLYELANRMSRGAAAACDGGYLDVHVACGDPRMDLKEQLGETVMRSLLALPPAAVYALADLLQDASPAGHWSLSSIGWLLSAGAEWRGQLKDWGQLGESMREPGHSAAQQAPQAPLRIVVAEASPLPPQNR